MKIGCDACGRAEAAVLCCADEAALCRRCDAAVHSANRLAGRHSRVALLSSTAGGPTPDAAIVDGSGSHPACDMRVSFAKHHPKLPFYFSPTHSIKLRFGAQTRGRIHRLFF